MFRLDLLVLAAALLACGATLLLPQAAWPAAIPSLTEPARAMTEHAISLPQAAPQSTRGSAPTAPAADNAPHRLQEAKTPQERHMATGPANLATDISQFGYELFSNPPSTFAPTLYVPVGPDYVVGPGDTIKIDIWGKLEGNWSAVIGNDGTISLPKVGVFGVTGLSFAELKELVHKKISKYYSGFEINVSMGQLRTIQVYVVGNAQRPGAYTISSLSTIINALFEGGGPSRTGSMRAIQVKRNGKTIMTFDLYDFLLQGDKSKDLRLMPEDVIFIPPTGAQAGVSGTVKTPAIYELKGETRLLDLIRMAGGLTGNAFKGRVQMRRIQDHQFRTVFEGNLAEIESNPAKNFVLQDGDMARIFPVADTEKVVTIAGAIVHPGQFGVDPGVTTVNELVSLAGGQLYYSSNQAEMTRITVTQDGPKTDIFHIDLVRAAAGDPQHNITLQANDYLQIRTIPEWSLYRMVTINGEVRYPGVYTIKQGETLSSLIERAGGFTERAYLRGSLFVRERVREQQQRQINEMAERLERELSASGASQVASASSPDDARMVQLELEQKRQFIAQLKSARAKGRIALNITPLPSFRGSAFDIELEQGDTISVPSDPKTVQVIGSVYNQSAFIHEPNREYGYYVDLAGGYSSGADKGNTFILQANGTTIKAGGAFPGFGERLGSGDTVVVPEKIERVAWIRNIKDITQIMYQIAVTAGVLLIAY